MMLSRANAPDVNLFFKYKTALDDNNFFHYRHDRGVALLPHGRHDVDYAADRYSFNLDTLMGQFLIDLLVTFASYNLNAHRIADDFASRYIKVFGVKRDHQVARLGLEGGCHDMRIPKQRLAA